MRQIKAAIAGILTLLAANEASAQALSNVLLPPRTVVGNVQGVSSGASAITFASLATLLNVPPAPNCAAGTWLTTLTINNVWVCTKPAITDISGLGAGVAAWIGTPSSANLRTAVTDETGSGSLVFATSPALVTPNLGTPSAAILTNATGLPVGSGVSGLGSSVAATLGVNVGSAGSVVVNGGALGTPSSGTGTNLTGVPIATGISGLGTGVATWAATPSSANLRAALTDESGTGAAYFQGGDLGTPSAGVATNITALNATQLTTGTIPAARTNGHMNGTATNDNAAAGEVGEYVSVLSPSSNATVTMTIASPAVVTWSSIPYSGTGTWTAPIVFTTTGALPTGVTASTQYWIIGSSVSGNTFQIATSAANALAGTAINTSGSQSGTHTGTSGIALTSNAGRTTSAISLTAGDWRIGGVACFGTGATTSVTDLYGSISTTLDTGDNTVGNWAQLSMAAYVPAGAGQCLTLPTRRVVISSPTTYHMVNFATFTVSTASGFSALNATRAR